MGTRSLTHIRETENGTDLVCIHRQMDGYCAGHGKDLKELLTGYKIVNGYSMPDLDCMKCGVNPYFHKQNKSRHLFQPKRVANGLGDLAALLITSLKTRTYDDFILCEPNSDWERYQYVLWLDGDYFSGKYGSDLPDVTLMLKVLYASKVLYSGKLEEFNPMMEREAA